MVLIYNLCGVGNGWGWYGYKEGVGKAGGIWWKDKEEYLVRNVAIVSRNICTYENDNGTLKKRSK